MTSEIKQRIEMIKNGEVPHGYKKTIIGIVPENWDYTRLDNHLVQHYETSEFSSQYPVLTSSRKGIFLQSDYYNKEVASEDNTGYNVVPRGYFTYRHMSDDEIFKFNINTIVDKGIVSTLYPVFTTKNINDYFLQALLNEGHEFRRYAILQKQGGSRTYMYFDKLKKLKVCLPSLPEQDKIAEILSTQDKVIELKEKRIAEKQRQKKYLMQQLLTGKQRLPGFSEEWRKCTIHSVSQPITQKAGSDHYEILSISAGIGFVSQSEKFGKEIAGEQYKNYTVIMVEDFSYNKGNSKRYPQGCIYPLEDRKCAAVPNVFISFRLDKKICSYKYYKFLFENGQLNKQLYRLINSGVRNDGLLNLYDGDFYNCSIPLPPINEQKVISDILWSIDHELTLLQKGLEAEKQKKKALMQLLLTGIVRVKA